jgi:glutamate racemase
MKDTIRNVLNELYNLKLNGEYVYRSVLSPRVELVDPAVETAKEAYLELRAKDISNQGPKSGDRFFITIPNRQLEEVKLQPDGWFTYEYKYGRKEGANKNYVLFTPFDRQNISAATYERLRLALPSVYSHLDLK